MGTPYRVNEGDGAFYGPHKGDLFILRVKGESMIEAGILDGDSIIVRQQTTTENGDIVVALIDDSATVKHFYKLRLIGFPV